MMIKVAVYDDSKDRRESLEAFIKLTPELQHVGSFANCANVLLDYETTIPDIILMDIEMPEADGLAGVRLLKENYPQVKIIMQTAFDDDEKIFAALQAGAEGYVLKTASVTQLAQSIDEVLKGGAAMTPSIALKVMRFFSQQKISALADYNLSSRESEVLKYLATGLSYKMIADQMGISYFTVNNHVKKIYEKLQVHSVSEAVSLAIKNKVV
ncbi:MAG: response regulator transcription factor [Ferruginibacter sp.]|nr:response regulator transcription factor [Ferruginibacter sp.]